jgi:hypothetical protein
VLHSQLYCCPHGTYASKILNAESIWQAPVWRGAKVLAETLAESIPM